MICPEGLECLVLLWNCHVFANLSNPAQQRKIHVLETHIYNLFFNTMHVPNLL